MPEKEAIPYFKRCITMLAALTAMLLPFFSQAESTEDVLTSCATEESICRNEWERSWCHATCLTIKNGVASVMDGIRSATELHDSVNNVADSWESWQASALFKLKHARDIEAYGNLYSLCILCSTLRHAAEDCRGNDILNADDKLQKQAAWLTEQSMQMSMPVAQIIRRQSYDSGIIRRIEIMQGLLHYARRFYSCHPNRVLLLSDHPDAKYNTNFDKKEK